jgi:hypothetical protein
MGGELNGAEMVHEWCSKCCSGVGHCEGVDWHGFATHERKHVQIMPNGANVYTPTCTICTIRGVRLQPVRSKPFARCGTGEESISRLQLAATSLAGMLCFPRVHYPMELGNEMERTQFLFSASDLSSNDLNAHVLSQSVN